MFPFYKFAGQCDHLSPASVKTKDLSYTTATPSLPLICLHGLHRDSFSDFSQFLHFLVHDGPLFIVSYFNILISFCGSLGVVKHDEYVVLLIHVQISVLSYIIP